MNKQEAIDIITGLYRIPVENGADKFASEINKAIDMAIAALQDDWIPVSERLPEELEEVLVCVKHNGKSKMAVSCRRDYNYWDSWGRDIIGEMAWQPLPDAYEGGDTE